MAPSCPHTKDIASPAAELRLSKAFPALDLKKLVNPKTCFLSILAVSMFPFFFFFFFSFFLAFFFFLSTPRHMGFPRGGGYPEL